MGALALLGGCLEGTGPSTSVAGVTPGTHRWFPLGQSDAHPFGKTTRSGETVACDSCHPPTSDTFTEYACTGCHIHDQALVDRFHGSVDTYSYSATSCYGCHSTPAGSFDHAGVTDDCAACHAEGTPWAALPIAGFTHMPINSDCSGCHETSGWANASTAPTNGFDPAQSVELTGQIPTYAGTSIASLSPLTEHLPMVMNHRTSQLPQATLDDCTGCHPQAALGTYFPGTLHAALASLGLAQPAGCLDCHRKSAPTGFVGPLATQPVRTPTSPEMKHDAVAWSASARTTTAVVTEDCALCHLSPDTNFAATWATADGGGAPAYHSSLTASAHPQPASCLDCHANSRPAGAVQSPSLPPGVTFDHSATAVMGECGPCHQSVTTWAGGRAHPAGSSPPASCLPCHEAERPTSTASWKSTTYTQSPFDYAGTTGGAGHGDGDDCVECHAGSAGATLSWTGGHYPHLVGAATRTCLNCHVSQRPTGVVSGFNHSSGGTGDCLGCHQATVTRGTYAAYPGDWSGGQAYPATSLVAAPGEFVKVTSLTLTRGAGQLISGMTSTSNTLSNAMLHTSKALPPSLSAGATPDYAVDQGKCWHCHTNNAGQVTDFTNGVLHAAFDAFRATPGGATSKLAQPTACIDCHAQMRPPGVVEKASSSLQPMDHAAAFAGAVTVGGVSVTSVSGLDCTVCHAAPGSTWADGAFHSHVGKATPADCAACHYPLMADGAKSDVTSLTHATMKHRSAQVATQACQTCHPSALSAATSGTTAAAWAPGAFHSSVTSQPALCNDCHSAATPSAPTQSTTSYTFAQGGTASNGGQWMSHAASVASGKECSSCHGGDAKASGSAWSRSTPLHAKVTTTTCNECHGGATPGTNNNLPAGLTDSSTVTTSSAAAANTHDQITHADANVTKYQCNFCHTQVGPSTASGIQGKEWAQAKFHKSFTSTSPLTGRCSNCHMNLRPGSGYAAQDHSAYTATSTTDCGSCHAWPGTSATTPNWKGTAAAHASSGSTTSSSLDCNSCHGQTGSASKHLSVAASSHYGGVSNGNRCTSCHVNFSAFSGTTANLSYGHANASANGGGCGTCHAFKGGQYTTLTTTPPLTYPVSSGSHSFSQNQNVTGRYDDRSFTANHTSSKLTNCGACHRYSSTTSSTNVWTFSHRPSNPGISNGKSSSGCNACH